MSNKLLRIVLICAYLLLLYELIAATYTTETTGSLQLSSPTPNTYFTVSQTGKQSINVGVDKAKIRLSPGTYQITASSNLDQTTKNVLIKKKGLVKLYLVPTNHSKVPASYVLANKLIAHLLPFTGPGFQYQVGYKYDFSKSVAEPIITITAPTSQGQQEADQWLESQGYNPSSLNIIYILAEP